MAVPAPAPAAPPPTPPAPAVAEPSAAEKLFSSIGAVWRNLSRLDAGEVALNLGLSILVIALVAVAIFALRRLLHASICKLTKEKTDLPKSGPPRIAGLTWLLIRLSLAAVALLVLLSIWGVDLIGWLTTSGTGAALSRVVGVVLIAFLLIEVSAHLVDRLLNLMARGGDQGRRTAQVRTLRPLVRGVVQGFIVVIASLTVLSELGVKIGPLLASAGVVGIAVGFGAQTLVKDFLTGLFLVVEDIVAVDDNVQIGDKSGTVEAMTLRTIRVRNMNGTLHILPYSEAQVISNRTQTFSSYIFDLSVGYGVSFDHAFAVMRRVGEALQADPDYGPKIIKPLEIMGVDQLGDFAVVLKARFQTRPGEQWMVGREYNKRIKEAFDAEGIEMPVPYRKLVFDEAVQQRLAEAFAPQPRQPGDDTANEPE